MDLLIYAAVLNNIVVDLHVFENNISTEALSNIAQANGFDYYMEKTEKTEIGSFIHEDTWVLPKPYDSWILNSNFDWVAPIEIPQDGGPYSWDENEKSWIKNTIR